MARVLVVEDNAANQRLMRMLLLSMGHEVVCASTGDEGWELLGGGGFALVLLDMHLPGLDGFQLCRRIKSSFPGQVMVIAVTALAMDGDRERVMESGCDGYFSKPISVPEFRSTVGVMLGEGAGGPGGPAAGGDGNG
jgi:two-component system cell cycle response regulator DivK